ncbi:MAG TPA: hypothetical protein VD963_02170 [Phycisphaerales bacterium]|nr:hypothetical protein [Phycisphaerales bacterium]
MNTPAFRTRAQRLGLAVVGVLLASRAALAQPDYNRFVQGVTYTPSADGSSAQVSALVGVRSNPDVVRDLSLSVAITVNGTALPGSGSVERIILGPGIPNPPGPAVCDAFCAMSCTAGVCFWLDQVMCFCDTLTAFTTNVGGGYYRVTFAAPALVPGDVITASVFAAPIPEALPELEGSDDWAAISVTPPAHNRSVHSVHYLPSADGAGWDVVTIVGVEGDPAGPRDLSLAVAVAVNGTPLPGSGGVERIVVGPGIPTVPNGPAYCQVFCVMSCGPASVCIPLNEIMCLCDTLTNRTVNLGGGYYRVTFTVPALSVGDVLEAAVGAAEAVGGVPEIDPTDNLVVRSVTPPAYNRAVRSVSYAPSADGTTGTVSAVVGVTSTPDATRDLSFALGVTVNGSVVPESGTTERIVMGPGIPQGPLQPAMCSFFCAANCPSPAYCTPIDEFNCLCVTLTERTTHLGDGEFLVAYPVPALAPGDLVVATVFPAPVPGALSEVDASDDWIALSVPAPPCPADWNGDGLVGTGDISGFLVAWFGDLATGTNLADFNASGATTTADITAFLGAWFQAVAAGGC